MSKNFHSLTSIHQHTRLLVLKKKRIIFVKLKKRNIDKMVKITSSFIDVYTTSPKYTDDILMSSSEKKKKPVAEIPFTSDNSDSETSFFDSSSDEEVTCFYGQCKTIDTNNNNKNAKIKEINKPRKQKNCLEPGKNKINMLFSPKLSRKQFASSALDLARSGAVPKETRRQKFYTADDASKLTLPLQQLRVGSQIDVSKSNATTATSPAEEVVLHQRNSYLLSPRIRRKQIDITKSPAYKEIYAHNLRLYSAVLAKQIASTSQVGKEMDDLRRNMIKRKALNTDGTKFLRSSSSAGELTRLTRPFRKTENGVGEDVRDGAIRNRRSNSAGADVLSSNIKLAFQARSQEDLLLPIDNKMATSEERTATSDSESDGEKKQTQLKQTEIEMKEISNSKPRSRAATLRAENLRKKLASFDITMDQTNEFLAKVKTITKS